MSKLQNTLNDMMQTLQLGDAPAGGSVVVYHQGSVVAQSSIGLATPHRQWDSDTLALNFSTGKGVLVTLIHVLVSNKLLAYDVPIAHYWSSFAHNGKQHITLRQVLTHQANLFHIQDITQSSADIFDWEQMLERVELMAPHAPANKKAQSAYSALVSGWVLGGLTEKVTGYSLNDALTHYLAEPLGCANQMYFGVGFNKLHKVATLAKNFDSFDQMLQPTDGETIEPCSKPQGSLKQAHSKSKTNKPKLKVDTSQVLNAYQSLPSYGCWLDRYNHAAEEDIEHLTTNDIATLYLNMGVVNILDFKNALIPTKGTGIDYYSPQALMAKIPAVNNIASADALAKMYAMLANRGHYANQRLISEDVFNELSKIYVTGADAIMPAMHPNSMQWRLGYHRVLSRCQDAASIANAFGHMGYNGSFAWCDVDKQLSMAYVHNYNVIMSTDIRQFALSEAVLSAL